MSIELIRQYVEADAEYNAAQKDADVARLAVDRALATRGRIEEELCRMVGANVSHKVWELDGKCVLVEWVRGNGSSYASIRIITPETR
jgi:rhamnose utilization protein RhaD (predicted bifunctional aldolase and dehydrogenase)